MAHTAAADTEMVYKVLLEADELPTTARQMLFDGLPHATPRGGELHPFQAQFLSALQSTLGELLRAAEKRQQVWREAIEASAAERQASEAAEREAAGAEAAASALAQERTTALEKCQATLATTRREQQQAELAKETMTKARAGLEASHSELGFLLEGPLRMLQEGGWGDEDVRDSAIDALQGFLKANGAEPALLAAAPAAFACRPEARAAFDRLAVSSAADFARAKAQALEAQLQVGQPEREAVLAEALGLWALADRQAEEEQAAGEALAEAAAAQQAAAQARAGVAAEAARQGEAAQAQLAARQREEAWGEELGRALGAVGRLLAGSYEPEAAAAAKDVEMASAKETEAAAPVHGNPLGVPTPMCA